jgi:glutamate racemase
MKIGVFDSGVGGLSVLKALLDARLFDEIIYYGDTARVPYGVKDRDTIVRFSLEALGFFAPFGIDMLIIACNTASAYALRALRASANFPVLGVIDAGVLAVQRALSDSNAQILVIGTKATIKSQQYQKRLFRAGFKRVQALATGLFVPMVEEGIFEGALVQAAFEHYFKPLNFGENVNFGGNLGEISANLSENSRGLNGCGLKFARFRREKFTRPRCANPWLHAFSAFKQGFAGLFWGQN